MNIRAELARFQITEADLENIRDVGKTIIKELPELMDRFYNNWMKSQTFYKSYFFDESIVQHIKGRQIQYWEQFFKAEIDEAYIASRKHLGVVHAQVGLSLTNYYLAMAYFHKSFERLLIQRDGGQTGLFWSFFKYLHWDMAIVSESRSASANEMLERMLSKQNQEISEMSVPISNLWSDILFLPIVGRVSSKRGLEILQTILKSVAEHQAEAIILDISGLSKLDKRAANTLLKIVKATKLMGCKAFISGISPEMAQAFVEIETDLEEFHATGSMMDAMIAAMESTGRKIIQIEEVKNGKDL